MPIEARLFGHVVTLAGKPSPSFLEHYIRPLASELTPAPGTLLAVELGAEGGLDAFTMVRVANAWEANPYEDAHSATLAEVLPFGLVSPGEGDSTVIFRICHSEPLEEVLVDQNGCVVSIRSISRLPRAGARVFYPWGDLIARTLGLEDDPQISLSIGEIRGSGVPARIRRDAIQRHFAILGAEPPRVL